MINTAMNFINSLPLEFDYEIYVGCESNTDLRGFNEAKALAHYDMFGYNEGRICSKVQSRKAFQEIVKSKKILEVGPFFSPAFSKQDFDVDYLDAFSTQDLKERCRALGDANDQLVPEIDYVWTGQPYDELINSKYSVVYSSHNVEHQPCLVTHFNDIDSVLEDDGVVMFVIPDKRYCFDHYLSESNFAEVIGAWAEKRKRHTIKNITEHYYLTTHNDVIRHWMGDHGPSPLQRHLVGSSASELVKKVESLQNTEEYIDVHAWKFTPRSFTELIQALNATGLIRLEIARIYPTVRNSNEFYAVLKRTI